MAVAMATIASFVLKEDAIQERELHMQSRHAEPEVTMDLLEWMLNDGEEERGTGNGGHGHDV